MKRVNTLITNVLQFTYKYRLSSFTKSFFISPLPPYLSQFVSIYPASISPEVLLNDPKEIKIYGAKDNKEFTFWVWRNCGITCVKMILESEKKALTKTIMDLTREGIELGGYILYEDKEFVDKGWFHHSLVALLRKYALSARMKKWQTIESVALDILANKKVIISITIPERQSIAEDGSFSQITQAPLSGHLVLATGVKMQDKKVIGVYIHDPRGLPNYQKNTFIPKVVFENIFTNRTIVAI